MILSRTGLTTESVHCIISSLTMSVSPPLIWVDFSENPLITDESTTHIMALLQSQRAVNLAGLNLSKTSIGDSFVTALISFYTANPRRLFPLCLLKLDENKQTISDSVKQALIEFIQQHSQKKIPLALLI